MFSISSALKKFREGSGYTQQQMADALGIDRSTYAYYETGKTSPSIKTLLKIKDILNVSIEELLESEHTQHRFFDISSSRDDFDKIYELSKKEKSLVSIYRSLPPELQNEILHDVSKKK